MDPSHTCGVPLRQDHTYTRRSVSLTKRSAIAVARMVVLVSFAAGEAILTEGESGDCMYIVMTGGASP